MASSNASKNVTRSSIVSALRRAGFDQAQRFGDKPSNPAITSGFTVFQSGGALYVNGALGRGGSDLPIDAAVAELDRQVAAYAEALRAAGFEVRPVASGVRVYR